MPYRAPEAFEVEIPRSSHVPPVGQRLASQSPQRGFLDANVIEERQSAAEERRSSRLEHIAQRNQQHIEHAKERSELIHNRRDNEWKQADDGLRSRLDAAEQRRLGFLKQRSARGAQQVNRAKQIARQVRSQRASSGAAGQIPI